MLMGAAGAAGGAVSGLVLSWSGYHGLNMAGGAVAVAVLAAALLVLLAGRHGVSGEAELAGERSGPD
jgi:hypothetical protein